MFKTARDTEAEERKEKLKVNNHGPVLEVKKFILLQIDIFIVVLARR